MSANISALLNLTLEIEGLLALAATRDESTPQAVFDLLAVKGRALSSELNALKPVETTPAPEPETPAKAVPKVQTVSTPVTAPAPMPRPRPAAVHTAVAAPAEAATVVAATRTPLQLTLNDKFRVMREIFDGDESEMHATLDMLASMTSDDEILDYLTNDLCLDPANPEVAHFISLIVPGH